MAEGLPIELKLPLLFARASPLSFSATFEAILIGLGLGTVIDARLTPQFIWPPDSTVVTNTFGSKTEERLRRISSNIIATAPTVEAMRDSLIAAAGRVAAGAPASTDIALPATWRTALQDTVAKAGDMFREAVDDAKL